MSRHVLRLRRSESGSVAVEFALVGLVAIVVFLGIIEFGRGLYMRNEMSYAMDLAARKILTSSAVPESELETIIRGAIAFDTSGGLQITFGTEMIEDVPLRTVVIQYPITLLIPGLTNASITLSVERRIPLG